MTLPLKRTKRTLKTKIFTTFHKKYRQTLILNTFISCCFEFATEQVIKDMCDFSRSNIISLTILFSAVFKLFLWANFSQASLWSSFLYAEFMKTIYRYNIGLYLIPLEYNYSVSLSPFESDLVVFAPPCFDLFFTCLFMSVNGALLTKASFLFFTDNVKLIYIYLNFVCDKNLKVAHVSKIKNLLVLISMLSRSLEVIYKVFYIFKYLLNNCSQFRLK